MNSPTALLDDARNVTRRKHLCLRAEGRALLAQLDGQYHLMASLLYGAGSRLMECVRRRVKDVDLDRAEIIVRSGKAARA